MDFKPSARVRARGLCRVCGTRRMRARAAAACVIFWGPAENARGPLPMNKMKILQISLANNLKASVFQGQSHKFRQISSVTPTSRTQISGQMWGRIASLKAYKANATRSQTELLEKSPQDSFISIDMPLASDPELKAEYSNFRGGVRFGKILEDIDVLSAFVGAQLFPH